MTLPNTRNRTYTPLSQVPAADLNDIQDSIILADYVRAQLADLVLGPMCQLNELTVRPDTGHLFANALSGAPFPSATTVRGMRHLAGGILQGLSGTIDGITPQTLHYHLTADEMAVQFTDNSSGNDRWDIVQVKLTRAATGAQRLTLAFSIKEGTPSGSPVEPSPDSGYVKWCAAKITNGMGASYIPAANVRDYRIPMGLRVYDINPRAAVYASGSWEPASASDAGIQAAAGTDALLAYPPGWLGSRLLKVGVAANCASSIVNLPTLCKHDYTVGGTGAETDLITLDGLKTATSVSTYREVDLGNDSRGPWWLNGSQAGYANRQTAALPFVFGTTADYRLALRWKKGAGTDIIGTIRFWVAG